MATGYSSIPSQLSHGGCVGDERRLTYSPPGPKTLRERDHDSPQHAVHDTCDGDQSDSQAAECRQYEAGKVLGLMNVPVAVVRLNQRILGS